MLGEAMTVGGKDRCCGLRGMWNVLRIACRVFKCCGEGRETFRRKIFACKTLHGCGESIEGRVLRHIFPYEIPTPRAETLLLTQFAPPTNTVTAHQVKLRAAR